MPAPRTNRQSGTMEPRAESMPEAGPTAPAEGELPSRQGLIARLETQLNDILAAVSKVSELDLSDVPPTSHPHEVVNVWDEDEPRDCLPVEEALANAPEREGGFFKVPPGAHS